MKILSKRCQNCGSTREKSSTSREGIEWKPERSHQLINRLGRGSTLIEGVRHGWSWALAPPCAQSRGVVFAAARAEFPQGVHPKGRRSAAGKRNFRAALAPTGRQWGAAAPLSRGRVKPRTKSRRSHLAARVYPHSGGKPLSPRAGSCGQKKSPSPDGPTIKTQ